MTKINGQDVSITARKVRERLEQINRSQAPKGKGETILVVEDEEMLRDFLEAVLGENGYKVMLAADGTEGVQTFVRHMNEIDLVVLDMGLPELSGEEVLSMIVALQSCAKVIAVSGSIEPEVEESALQIGAMGYLPKPYLSEELLTKVHETLHSGVHLNS